MTASRSLAEIEKAIQIVEDNLRQLQEQAAAYSGAADEERNADRIAEQEARLDALLKERAALRAAKRRDFPVKIRNCYAKLRDSPLYFADNRLRIGQASRYKGSGGRLNAPAELSIFQRGTNHMMSKSELIQKVADEFSLAKKDVKAVMESLASHARAPGHQSLHQGTDRV